MSTSRILLMPQNGSGKLELTKTVCRTGGNMFSPCERDSLMLFDINSPGPMMATTPTAPGEQRHTGPVHAFATAKTTGNLELILNRTDARSHAILLQPHINGGDGTCY